MIEKKYLYWVSLIIFAILYFVWPTIHTLILKKVLLVSGAGLAIYFWIKSSERKIILSSSWLMYSGLLLAWVIFHATFLTQSGGAYPFVLSDYGSGAPRGAWREFLGQWVPAYVALLAGIGCALACRTFPERKFNIYLMVMLASPSIFYLFFTVIKAVYTGEIVTGFDNWGITDHKMSLTFYANLLAAGACAKIIDAVKSGEKFSRITWWSLPIALAFYVAFFSDSLNGFILVGGCVLLTVAAVVYMNRKNIPAGAWAIAVLLSGVFLYALGTSAYVAAKREVLVSTTRIALDIDTYTHWRNVSQFGLPKDEHGVQVTESLYLRMAYATAGLRTIVEHPWGYGVTRKAFERLIQQKYPGASIANSHNGYIDLVSAVGFPALILLALMVISVFRQLRRSSSEWARPAMWMIGLIAVHWMIDPISRDHYFETTLFLIGLFATLTLERKAEHAGQT